MRKLMWFSLGFGAGVALAVYLLPLSVLLLAGIPLCLTGLFVLFRKPGVPLRILGVILLALGIGLLWYRGYDALLLKPLRALDSREWELTFTASDYSWDSDYGISLDASAELEGRRFKARIYLDTDDALNPGDMVTGVFQLRYTGPGALRDQTHHAGSGILFLAYPRGESQVTEGEGGLGYFPARLRRTLQNRVGELFPEDSVPFLQALLLGESSGLDYATETALSLSGLRHVAAVSGLHLSILFSVVFFFTRRNRYLSLLVGAPVLLIFSAMVGFTPSILRSALMQLLMLGALALDREYDPPTALGFAALIMIAGNPLTVTAVGFQLSVASVAGILLVAERLRSWLMDPKRLGRWKFGTLRSKIASWFSVVVSVTLGALLFNTPLTAWYFGSVSLLCVLTNLLCLWAVTLLFCGSLAALALGTIWLPLGKCLGWCLGWVVRYVLTVAGLIAKFPLSLVYTQSPYVVLWLVIVYGLLGLFLFGKKKRPLMLVCTAALTLCLALTASWTEPVLGDFRMTALDVGQGQCILLQSGGLTYMVDCGGSHDETTANTAAGMLLSQGITRLDGLILTHYDRDHTGAAAYLLQRIPTDVLILPPGEGDSSPEGDLLSQHTGDTVCCAQDLEICWEDGKITVFAGESGKTSNESSLCVLFQTEKCAILITGDRDISGELELLRHTPIPRLDVLVAGHHGAANSTGEPLLRGTLPHTVVISVGKDNRYDHPSPLTLERLQALGCVVRRTDLEGTIIIGR